MVGLRLALGEQLKIDSNTHECDLMLFALWDGVAEVVVEQVTLAMLSYPLCVQGFNYVYCRWRKSWVI